MASNEAFENLIKPTVVDMGFEFWGVEYFARANESLLRVFIDSENGISVDNCAEVSRQLSLLLDVEDLIISEYRLEVSSPGMARRFFNLEQYQEFIANKVKLKLRYPFEGSRNYTGVLMSVDLEGNELSLAVDDEEITLPYEIIEKGVLIPSFS